MIEKNPDLVALHTMLGTIVDALVVKQEQATDPAVIKAVSDEIRETLFRVTTVQQALFKQQTETIKTAVAKVEQAKADVEAAIANIEKINNFIKTISAFLGLVDKVMDVVKLI